MSVFTVGKLRKALNGLPDDLPVGLSVYNHSWYANCHAIDGHCLVAEKNLLK